MINIFDERTILPIITMAPKMRVFLLGVLFLAVQINCAPNDLVPELDIKDDAKSISSAEENLVYNATEKDVLPPEPTNNVTQNVEKSSTTITEIPTEAPNYEEADDMEYHGTFENRTVFEDTAPIELPVVDFADPPPSSLKDETEWLEENEPDAVDIDLPKAHATVQLANERSWPGIIAMTALFAAIVLVIFAGLLSYKYVTMKYHNRQILINEEDMIDPNDMKHFTL